MPPSRHHIKLWFPFWLVHHSTSQRYRNSLRSSARKQERTPGSWYKFYTRSTPLQTPNTCLFLLALISFSFFYWQASQKGDPLAALKKQLEEKEKQLTAEQGNVAAAKTRVRELTKVTPVNMHSWTNEVQANFYSWSSFLIARSWVTIEKNNYFVCPEAMFCYGLSICHGCFPEMARCSSIPTTLQRINVLEDGWMVGVLTLSLLVP